MDDNKQQNDMDGVATPAVTPESAGTIPQQNDSESTTTTPDNPIGGSIVEPVQSAPTPTPEVVTSSEIPNAVPSGTSPKVSSHGLRGKKWFMPVIALGIVGILGGSAYGYFGVYMQSPSQVWKRALARTASGYSQYASQSVTPKKGAKLTGSFKVSSPTVADGTMSLLGGDKKFIMTADAGASGVRANVELRGITAQAGSSPDLYVKLSGVKGVGDLLGMSGSPVGSTLSSADGKWYVVDHTLFDQALASSTNGSVPAGVTSLSAEQLQKDMADINKRVADVVSDRLLSTDPKKAVLTVQQNLGKEDFRGKKTQKYRVKVQKDQFRDMTVALKDTLKDSKLKEWMSKDSSQTFEKAIGFDDLLKSIESANYDKALADVWVDTDRTYIRNVRVQANDAKGNTTGTIDFLLDYNGGDDLPFEIAFVSTKKGDEAKVTLTTTLNQKNQTATIRASVDAGSADQKLTGTIDIKAEGTDEPIAVEKPTGAQNMIDLITPLMQGASVGSVPGLLPTPQGTSLQ